MAMAPGTQALDALFKPEKERGINFFWGGRTSIEYTTPKPEEIEAVDLCINNALSVLRRTSPILATDYEKHRSVFHKFAGIAKAKFPGNKPIMFPSQTGTIGCLPLIPQAIRYVASPDATKPAYSSYALNSWDISLTAGTPAYILGDGTNFYKASPTTEQHSLIVIIENGLIEIGTSPKIAQMRLWTQAETKYGIWAANPIKAIPIEPGKVLYQYNTLGVIPIYHDFGIMWKILPDTTGISTLPLLGMVFYEHDLYPDTKWLA
jgi:hypothetical protein